MLGLSLGAGHAAGQFSDLAALYDPAGDELHSLLFTEGLMSGAGTFRKADLASIYPHLTLAGDFNGDGVDELAFFGDLLYKPNLNPGFTRSVVSINRSDGSAFIPLGTWFSMADSLLRLACVPFAVAGDFNLDGFCDIALFYNDPALELLSIFMLPSTGSGFSELQTWYSVNRNDFNFTALEHVSAGDFNGNGKPDIGVFYNYFGAAPETSQSIFIFESSGNSLDLLGAAFEATRADLDFSLVSHVVAGDFNGDAFSDMAVLYENPADHYLEIPVFEGTPGGQLSPLTYISFDGTGPDPAHVLHAAGGQLTGDSAWDLALFYDNPLTGLQEILQMENVTGSFLNPDTILSFEAGTLSVADIAVVRSGNFTFRPVVSAATWKDDRSGALSFTFDDGYRGAFEHGGAELEDAGLKGSFYIFTDTSAVYDGELAAASLVRSYRDMGHEIGSHTANHTDLGELSAAGELDSLDKVLSSSIDSLNARYNQYTMCMSIPFGSFRFETLENISLYFHSSRSSQHGFNLATPYDFFALKSWPVLSITSPAFVDTLLSMAEHYGTYLPLMYHDMEDEPFDPEQLIYTYSRELFRETIGAALARDLWVDTHSDIYKYIRERNALKIIDMDDSEMDLPGGNFSFVADDGLPDSIFSVPLTLKISLPTGWMEDSVSIGPEGAYSHLEVIVGPSGNYVLFDWLPAGDIAVHVHDGIYTTTGIPVPGQEAGPPGLSAYPNPFLRETRIRISDNDYTDSHLLVRDINGKIMEDLQEMQGDSFVLPRNGLTPGVYIIQMIRSGVSVSSLKVIVL